MSNARFGDPASDSPTGSDTRPWPNDCDGALAAGTARPRRSTARLRPSRRSGAVASLGRAEHFGAGCGRVIRGDVRRTVPSAGQSGSGAQPGWVMACFDCDPTPTANEVEWFGAGKYAK